MANSENFSKFFTPDILKKADAILVNYETKRASSLEILRLFMEEYGYITLPMEEAVAEYLQIAPIDVREVMTFYTLFYTRARAKTRFHVCRTLACHLAGANDLIRHIEEKLGIQAGEQTKDGAFSLDTVECLGACELAPMMQLNDGDFEGHLTKEKIDVLIEMARKGELKDLFSKISCEKRSV